MPHAATGKTQDWVFCVFLLQDFLFSLHFCLPQGNYGMFGAAPLSSGKLVSLIVRITGLRSHYALINGVLWRAVDTVVVWAVWLTPAHHKPQRTQHTDEHEGESGCKRKLRQTHKEVMLNGVYESWPTQKGHPIRQWSIRDTQHLQEYQKTPKNNNNKLI